MSITSKLLCLTLLSAPVLVGMSAPASANVRSSNSSSVCQWQDTAARSGGNGQYEAVYTESYGVYHTNEGNFPRVACNIPRNLPLRTDGMSDLEVRFRVVTPGTGTSIVFCSAYSFRSDGTMAAVATRSLTVDMTQAASTVSIDWGSAISVSGSKGNYLVSCSLPANVGLVSIYTSENDGIANN